MYLGFNGLLRFALQRGIVRYANFSKDVKAAPSFRLPDARSVEVLLTCLNCTYCSANYLLTYFLAVQLWGSSWLTVRRPVIDVNLVTVCRLYGLGEVDEL